MADIQEFYGHLSTQAGQGWIELVRDGPFAQAALLEQLDLNRLRLTSPSLSALGLDGSFEVNGRLEENGRVYDCVLSARQNGDKIDCSVTASLRLEGPGLLSEFYPPAPARLAEHYFSTQTDLFTDAHILSASVRVAGGAKAELAFVLRYGVECPIYKKYRDFVPDVETEVEWKGPVQHPFGKARYSVRAEFVKAVELPFQAGNLRVDACALTLKSHTEDPYNWTEDTFMCLLQFHARVPLTALSSKGVWLCFDLLETGQFFLVSAAFEDRGFSGAEALQLVANLSGQDKMVAFPEWLPLNQVRLVGATFALEREIAAQLPTAQMTQYLSTPSLEGVFLGLSMQFALDLPSLPVPFFDHEQGGGAEVQLMIQWDLLDIGGALSVVLGFYAVWKDYHILLNITLPSLDFEGRYERSNAPKVRNGSIFPGFMDLTVESIRLYGSLRDHTYGLNFLMENKRYPDLPIGKHLFQINSLEGSAGYSPEGLELRLKLGFTLLGAVFLAMGSYSKEGGTQILTLEGGLAQELRLSQIISLISGRESGSALDLSIKVLRLKYVTALSEATANSLGKPRSFSFLCTIQFDWGSGSVGTTFDMSWVPDVYTFRLSGTLTVLDFLALSASCTVNLEEGEAEFQNFAFQFRLKEIEITATYDKEKNLAFQIKNFSLGGLIEGLVSLIAPDHNWYLPWPFKLLKQISIKDLSVVINNQERTLRAVYKIDFKLLFLTVESIELLYNMDDGDFLVNVQVTGGLEGGALGERNSLGLNLLKDIFPKIPGMGEKQFELQYLAVGQHIRVDIPASFDDTQFPAVLEHVKKAIKKTGRPTLDPKNNWVAALQLKLLKAFDVTLLMCDPTFYGVEVAVGKGFELSDQLAGLKVTILYSKITETIGLFFARLTLPEVFRVIDLGAVQIQLGEIALSIYTNGNFKIDLGFPYNKDFTRSFGLTYLFFTGKGGFYFGILNGDTSQNVPKVERGHFDTVVELGVGISAGVGREISLGPLKAGAYVTLTVILQGVFASYISEQGDSSAYYKLQATAGVTASVYGAVDFVIIKAGFSLNASFMVDLYIERYQKTLLTVDLNVSVSAYLKILFIKISFSFRFHWSAKFELGQRTVAPWELGNRAIPGTCAPRTYALDWFDGAVYPTPRTLSAEMVYLLSFDRVEVGKAGSGARKIAFLAMLHGAGEETVKRLHYRSARTTPLAQLSVGLLRRVCRSVRVDGQSPATLDRPLLEWLSEALSQPAAFGGGFTMEQMDRFLQNNFLLHYMKGNDLYDGEIQGVPFPLLPHVTLEWYSATQPPRTETFDLSKDPAVDDGFLARLDSYYAQLAVEQEAKRAEKYLPEEGSAAQFLFTQYFYMATRVVLSALLEEFPEEPGYAMSFDEAENLLTGAAALERIGGMLSRMNCGGARVVTDDAGGVQSAYTYAHQQLDGLDGGNFPQGAVVHRMTMRFTERPVRWARLLDNSQFLARRNRYVAQSDQETELVWALGPEDLTYPGGALECVHTPELLPFYRQTPETLELKNPKGVSGEAAVTFLEAERALPEQFIIAFDAAADQSNTVFRRGFLLYLTVTRVEGDTYSIGAMGIENLEKIRRIQADTVLSMEAYRLTTPFDSDQRGFHRLPDDVVLYRTNLCLESEKPELRRALGENAYENSATLTEGGQFASLLRDSGLVNSRGYFLRLQIDGDYALEDGQASLVLWVETKVQADAVKLLTPYEPEREKPTVHTGQSRGVCAYRPGTLAFSLEAGSGGGELAQSFQMLCYQVLDGGGFCKSHESAPLFAQREGEGETARDVYAQVVPACRFASGDKDDPYRGVQGGGALKLAFSLVDVVGNKSETGTQLTVDYGYTDPLWSPTGYPHTKCTYHVEACSGGYDFVLTFSYMEGDGEAGDLREAYWQLMQADVTLTAELWGAEKPLDLAPLREYVGTLYGGGVPSPVEYRISRSAPGEDYQRIDLSLTLARDKALLAGALRETPEAAAVLRACVPVREDDTRTTEPFLARRGRDGALFVVSRRAPSFREPEAWTLPPLWNRLVNLQDITVKNMDGTEVQTSYFGIDLEVWADSFLADFENFLAPGSPYGDRETLEGLLEIKRTLAGRISEGAIPIAGDHSDYGPSAREFYRNELLRNLYLGRGNDAVLVAKSDFTPGAGEAWLYGIKATQGDVTLKPGKFRDNGRVELGIRVADVTKQPHLNLACAISLTDIEVKGDNGYDYLTLLSAGSAQQSFEVWLPYKRVPELPALISHGGGESQGAGASYYQWDYNLDFSHRTADQDLVTVRLVLENRTLRRASGWRLPEALARYLYLQSQFQTAQLGDSETAHRLLEICREIGEAWSYYEEKGLRSGRELTTVFRVDHGANRLVLVTSGVERNDLGVELLLQSGAYAVLTRQGDSFLLPDEPVAEPWVYRFHFCNLDIRRENVVNAFLSVGRNQMIPDIDPRFVYETGEVSFDAPLLPFLQRRERIPMGKFQRENFIARLAEAGQGLGVMRLELTCQIPMGIGGELLSRVPVLFAPALTALERESQLGAVFDQADAWLTARLEGRRTGTTLRVYATFHDASDPERNLLELTALEFAVE